MSATHVPRFATVLVLVGAVGCAAQTSTPTDAGSGGSGVGGMSAATSTAASTAESTSTASSSSGMTSSGGESPGCSPPLLQCGDQCVDGRFDPTNCGACGIVCPEGEVCSMGVCALQCFGGTTKCGDKCADTSLDPLNCGGCGQLCTPVQLCIGGVCKVNCGLSLTLCADQCVDLTSDPKHCGKCGETCSSGQVCALGKCSSILSCKAIQQAEPNSKNGLYTIDPNGGDPGDAYEVYCDMASDGGGWTYRWHKDLVAYWSFDDVDFANSDFGGFAGSPTNVAQSTEAPTAAFALSAGFGDTDTKFITLSNALPFGTQTTLVYWTRLVSCVNNRIPFLTSNDYYLGDHLYDGRISYLSGNFFSGVNTCAANLQVWNHHAIVDDGTQYVVYKNGQPVLPTVNTYQTLSGGSILRFGSRPNFGTNGLGGQLDDVAMFKRALTATEIQQIHSEGLAGRPFRYK